MQRFICFDSSDNLTFTVFNFSVRACMCVYIYIYISEIIIDRKIF